MTDTIDVYLFAAILIAASCGLESYLAGRGLAIATHIVAAVVGYYGLAASDFAGLPEGNLISQLAFAMAALFLCYAWLSEADSLRLQEDREARGDGANHVIAFAVGLSCAMRADVLIVCGCVEMFALFLRRARAASEPFYSGGGGLSRSAARGQGRRQAV